MKLFIIITTILLTSCTMKTNVDLPHPTLPVDGQFPFPELPYAQDALEPVMSAETIEFHYGKHFRGYVNNVNKMIAGTDMAKKSLEEIVLSSDGSLFNNAGQALNHLLYFNQFRAPSANNLPVGKLSEKITAQYGSFDRFLEEFETVSAGLFGSGWVFLSSDAEGTLHLTREANGGNSITSGLRPLLAFDLWEHAYYLDYRNLRAKHLKEIWSIIDWNVAEKRYLAE